MRIPAQEDPPMLRKMIAVIVAAATLCGAALAPPPMRPRRAVTGGARAFMVPPSITPTSMARRSSAMAPSTAGTGFGPAEAGGEPGLAELPAERFLEQVLPFGYSFPAKTRL